MSLSNQIKELRKQKVISNFKTTYPQVFDYFNSDTFIERMVNCQVDSIILPIFKRIGSSMCTEPVEELPFYDKEGKVDIDDIQEYLEAEGFYVEISVYGYQRDLVIKLGEQTCN